MVGFCMVMMLFTLIKSEDSYCDPLKNLVDCSKAFECIWANDIVGCVRDPCNISGSCENINDCKNITVEEMDPENGCRIPEEGRLIKTYCVSKDRNVSLCDTIRLQVKEGDDQAESHHLTECKCMSEDWCSGHPRQINWGTDTEPDLWSVCTLGKARPDAPWDQNCKVLGEQNSCDDDIGCYNNLSNKCTGDPCYVDNINWNYDESGVVEEVVVCHPSCSHGTVTLTKDGDTDIYDFCFLPSRADTIDQCTYYSKDYECTQTTNAGNLTVQMSVLMLFLTSLVLVSLL